MKKSIYIVLAVLVAFGLTLIQILIAGSVVKKNEMELCRAIKNIKPGNIIRADDIETIKIYKGENSKNLLAAESSEFSGKTASRDIAAGSILCLGDIKAKPEETDKTGFVALEVNGENFNAYNLEKGDFVDIYIMPDLSKIENNCLLWLNDVFAKNGIVFIPGKQPGVLIENVLIAHIDTATGQNAKYVSIRVPRPLDEVIAFLEQISIYEFIGR